MSCLMRRRWLDDSLDRAAYRTMAGTPGSTVGDKCANIFMMDHQPSLALFTGSSIYDLVLLFYSNIHPWISLSCSVMHAQRPHVTSAHPHPSTLLFLIATLINNMSIVNCPFTVIDQQGKPKSRGGCTDSAESDGHFHCIGPPFSE
jgi:hypothetical protein